MNALFSDSLSYMQWIVMILVPNDRSSLDLHFGILHVIFGWLCGVLDDFPLVSVLCSCTVPMSLWLLISCDPLNGSLWFLSQIIDRLEIFIWVCGLCGSVGCVGIGHHSHFGRFLGHLFWVACVAWFNIPKYFGMPILLFDLPWTQKSIDRIYSVYRFGSQDQKR